MKVKGMTVSCVPAFGDVKNKYEHYRLILKNQTKRASPVRFVLLKGTYYEKNQEKRNILRKLKPYNGK